MTTRPGLLFLFTAILSLASAAQAQLRVGIAISVTVAAEGVGIPQTRSFAQSPTTIGGPNVESDVIGDAAVTTNAVVAGEHVGSMSVKENVSPEARQVVCAAGVVTPSLSSCSTSRGRGQGPAS